MEIIVGIGEMAISANKGDTLVTHALGSCLGLTAYDPAVNVGGLIHCLMPSSKMNPEKADASPALFVDTGIPLLFEKLYSAGAVKGRIIVKMAGCMNSENNDDFFKIGEKNYIMARKLMWKNNIFISGEDIGGAISRTLSLDVASGVVSIKSAGNCVRI